MGRNLSPGEHLQGRLNCGGVLVQNTALCVHAVESVPAIRISSQIIPKTTSVLGDPDCLLQLRVGAYTNSAAVVVIGVEDVSCVQHSAIRHCDHPHWLVGRERAACEG